MGEYADMMLDGTLCECCGTFIDDEGGEGIPRYCSNQCARDRGADHALPHTEAERPSPSKVNCPICNKRVKKAGIADHLRDAHQSSLAQVAAEKAGPDLLAALRRLLRFKPTNVGDGDDPEHDAAWQYAEQALAAATSLEGVI